MTDYREKARDYINHYIDIESEFWEDEKSIDWLVEHLIYTIEVDYSPEWTDERYDEELTRQHHEIIDVIYNEYGDAINAAIQEREKGTTPGKNTYDIYVFKTNVVKITVDYKTPGLQYFHICHSYKVATKLYKAILKHHKGAVILKKRGCKI